MPSLSDVIANSVSQIRGSSTTARDQLTSTFNQQSAQQSYVSDVTRTVQAGIGQATGAVQNAAGVGMRDVSGALSSVLHGDLSGAVSKLANSPKDILGSLASSFGFGGGTLKGPGGGDAGKAGNSLAGALARSDPMLSYQWYCILPDIRPQGGATTPALPWYYVEEATPAFRNFNVRSVFREGREKHYPSTYSVDALRLAIYADSQNKAMEYLANWQAAILYPTSSKTAAVKGGGYGRPSGTNAYKKTIKIYLVNAAKKELAVLEYTECWPQTIDSYSLDSGTSSRILNHVTFNVGDMFFSLYDVSKTNLGSMLGPSSSFGTGALSGLVPTALSGVSSTSGLANPATAVAAVVPSLSSILPF